MKRGRLFSIILLVILAGVGSLAAPQQPQEQQQIYGPNGARLKPGMLLINVQNLLAGKLAGLTGTRPGETRVHELKPGANFVEAGAYKVTARWANNQECSKSVSVPPGDANPPRMQLTPDCK